MPSRRVTRIRSRRGGQNLLGFAMLAVAVVIASIIFSRQSDREVSAEVISVSPVVGQFDTVSVPVPIEPVSAGMILKDVRFTQVSFPRHQVPVGAVLEIKPFLASMAIAPLPANLPIFEKNLSMNPSASNPVIDRIPDGMRAITVKVDATGAVEGWASSGAIVDVLLVTGEGTRVVAEKVRILSAARSVNPIQNSSSDRVPSTVTLLVTQEQALTITTAAPHGKITFALRSLGDQGRWAERRYDRERLHGRDSEKPEERVEGFFRVEGEKARQYALRGGRWIRTEVVPAGWGEEDNE